MPQTKFNLELDFNQTIPWFYLILFLTLLNAFYNFLCTSYGLNYPYNTFLFSASDLHADLVKAALSYLNKNSLNYQNWSSLYLNYLIRIPILFSHGFTNLHMTPLGTLITIMDAKLIQMFTPYGLLVLFYSVSMLSIYKMVSFFTKNEKENILIFSFILLSYPILFMLTRGHVYSLVTNIVTIFFLYHIWRKNNIIIPIILLVIMFNMRPNSLFLGLLFFVYGFKNGFRALVLAGFLSIVLFAINLIVVNQIYNDYTFENFTKGVKIYYEIYVLGNRGNTFNNSMLSLVKIPLLTIFKMMHYDKSIAFNIIGIFNTIILIFGSSLGVYSLLLFMKKKINTFEVIFLITSLFVLVSSIFATYYMAIFFVFLLLPLKMEEVEKSRFFILIMIVCVMMLSPKNYIFMQGISLEVIINPLVMLSAIGYIIYKSHYSKMETL